METTNRFRIISIVIIFLLIINLAGVATLLYHRCKAPYKIKCCGKECCMTNKEHPGGPPCCFDKFMEKEMNLKKEQADQMQKMKEQFHQVADKYFDSIDMQENAMFEELKKDNPDLARLKSISEKSGELFTELKIKSTDHFLSIKSLLPKDKVAKFFDFIQKNGGGRMGTMGGGMKCAEGKGACGSDDHMKCKGEKGSCPDHKGPGDKGQHGPGNHEKP